jgi:hypothetical protein
MRFWTPLRLSTARLAAARFATALCGTLLLCLAGVSTAEAAPSHSRVSAHRVCGARFAPCRLRTRVRKAVQPAPPPYSIRVQRLVHRRHPGAWIERSRPDPLRDLDDAALQDRTLVSGEDDLLLAALEPLGVLAPRQCPTAASAVVDRHSPRGPPLLLLSESSVL